MNNYTDSLVDEYIPGLTYNENGEILVLVYDAFLKELANNYPTVISTPALIDFVKTLGKNKSGGINEKEKYKASDNIGHEFDYVNSYIYSTLGDSTETNEINAGSVPV